MCLNRGDVDVLDDNTSTHISSTVDINTNESMSYLITHVSGREWRERENNG